MAQAFATMMDGTRREVPVEVNGNLFRVPVNGIPQDTKSLEIHLDDFCATAGTDGYFLIPTVTESNRPSGLVRFHPRTDTEYVSAASNLPLFGIKNGSHAVLAIMRGMNIFYDLVYGVRDGKYYLHPRIRLNGEAPYETPEILLLNLYGDEADWAGMARAYRRYQIERGACVPLRERAKKYPVLAETARGTLIRIRLAWKPVPPPVLEQTPETEPPVFAAVTLKRCGEIIEECHRKGIRNLEFSIVGWNIGGHDGRWPDVFPVEPKIGTEEELKALIRKAKEYGYLFSNHANAIGSYAISSRRKESMLLRDRDGKPCNGGQWGGGQSSQLCPKATHHLRVEDMEKYVELGFRGTQYYDAISMIQPFRAIIRIIRSIRAKQVNGAEKHSLSPVKKSAPAPPKAEWTSPSDVSTTLFTPFSNSIRKDRKSATNMCRSGTSSTMEFSPTTPSAKASTAWSKKIRT